MQNDLLKEILMEVLTIGYVAIICQNLEESLNFYCNGLGLKKIYSEPNRDDNESTQILLASQKGPCLMLIGPNDPKMKLSQAALGVGSMQYLTFYVTNTELDNAFYTLSNAGIQISEEIKRGYERIIFIEDPSGTLVTLTSWKGINSSDLSNNTERLKKAESFRRTEKSEYIQEHHLEK